MECGDPAPLSRADPAALPQGYVVKTNDRGFAWLDYMSPKSIRKRRFGFMRSTPSS